MPLPTPYMPHTIFAVEDGAHRRGPRVLIAPHRYIQGDRILEHLGRYLSLLPSTRAALLIYPGGQQRDGARLVASLRQAAIDAVVVTFQGACSVEEVARVVGVLQATTPPVDCVIAVGGGKCVDAGKCVAARLVVPVVICPSVASNDAPCSAASVMYTPAGGGAGVEFFPQSPALVVIDTRIVAEAPGRYLVAGMGEAMATWYEARTCLQNPQARSVLWARPTLAASALGELCATTVFAAGVAAVDAGRRRDVTAALERIVEAKTLLSGSGVESGGLAVAHSVARGCPVLPTVPQQYLHGEMVAMGLLPQLMVEHRAAEAQQGAAFFAQVGLPLPWGQLALSPQATASLRLVMETAMRLPDVGNEPFALTADTLLAAAQPAHA